MQRISPSLFVDVAVTTTSIVTNQSMIVISIPDFVVMPAVVQSVTLGAAPRTQQKLRGP
jgi:hypothetical protein